MSEPKDGGPAFPGIAGSNGNGNCTPLSDSYGNTTWVEHNQGISVRDHFAIKILAAYIGVFCNTGNETPTDELMAGWSYAMADALLAARRGGKDL